MLLPSRKPATLLYLSIKEHKPVQGLAGLRNSSWTLVRWREFFATQEDDHEYQPSIFRKEKTNLPRNHKPPEEPKMFCHAVKSEILDPENRIKSDLTYLLEN